jgi:hypothetical protein
MVHSVYPIWGGEELLPANVDDMVESAKLQLKNLIPKDPDISYEIAFQQFGAKFLAATEHVHPECNYPGYGFFLVGNNKIMEVVQLGDFEGSGFDPSLLVPQRTSELEWTDEEDWSIANDIFWYRQFYSETRIGQLMVLRPDKPKIYDAQDIKQSYSYEFDEETTADVAANELIAATEPEDTLDEVKKIVLGVKSVMWILVALTVIDLLLRLK